VKICGLTTERDVKMTMDCGADAAGVVVGAPSPRAVKPETARELLRRVDGLERVAVTVWEGVEKTVELARVVCPTAMQLHGIGTPSDLTRLREMLEEEGLREIRVITSIAIGQCPNRHDLLTMCRSYAGVSDRILLDTRTPGLWGGTGMTHDWEISRWLRKKLGRTEVILAGGLSQGNIQRAIAKVRPFGVDVSSGVEARPGIKDPDLVRRFVSSAKEA